MTNPINSKSGFSLIEIAAVIMIVGLVMIPLTQMYGTYLARYKIDTTKDNIQSANNEISSYKTTFLTPHYPCPSDRALPPGDPNYGREFNGGNCTLAALQAILGVLTTAPRCTATGGFCMVRGARDTAVDANTTNDPILIGGLPMFSIEDQITTSDPLARRVPIDTMNDGYGNQMTYMVTQSQVDSALYDSQNGVIAVIDENGLPTAGINNNGNYVVISHGEDGRGAFSRAGVLHATCAGIAARDGENCDNDETVRQALGFFKAPGTTYFDDVIYIGKSGSSELWSYIYNSAGTNTGKINNLNVGNIGIKTPTPETKLDVAGTVRVDNTARTTQICKTDDSLCFNVNAITGSGTIRCPLAGQVMRGITLSTAECITPTFPVTINGNCGTAWVRGVRADGCVICSNGVVSCVP